jgi:hypothetical protein
MKNFSMAILTGMFLVVGQAYPAAAADMSVDQLLGEFTRAGYRADRVSTSTDGLGIVFVTDQYAQQTPNARVLMVLVYPDAASAAEVRERAGDSAHLVPGYGPSVWLDNVALVQSSWSVLEARYMEMVDADMGTRISTGPETDWLDYPNFTVDLEFVALLQRDRTDL